MPWSNAVNKKKCPRYKTEKNRCLMNSNNKKKRLKRQKFIGIAAIFQNLLSRNGRLSFEKLENIYSYHSYLF